MLEQSPTQAFKVGAITALAVTPWGELWVGSSRGSLRVFSLQDVTQGHTHTFTRPHPSARELRRTGGGKPHGGAVTNIIIPLGGQVCELGALMTSKGGTAQQSHSPCMEAHYDFSLPLTIQPHQLCKTGVSEMLHGRVWPGSCATADLDAIRVP